LQHLDQPLPERGAADAHLLTGTGLQRRLLRLGDHAFDRAAGHEARDHEHQDGDADEGRHDQQQSAKKISSHETPG